MKFLVTVLSLLVCKGALGEPTVLIRAHPAEIATFLSYVESRPETMAYSDWWIRNRVSERDEAEIKRLLGSAQNEFLKGDLATARQKFSKLIELSKTQDWRSAERKAFAYGEMRLAQLSSDEAVGLEHARQAARWGNVGLQADLFPVPLWSQYQSELLSHNISGKDLTQRFPGARYLLIDGKPLAITSDETFEVDALEHRFTLVYDDQQPLTRVLTWETLESWRPARQPLIAGDCADPQWKGSKPNSELVKAFFSTDCLVDWNKKTDVSIRDLTPRSGNAEPMVSFSEQQSAAKPFWKKGWFWGVTGAAVVTAIVVSSRQNRDSGTVPSTTEGF